MLSTLPSSLLKYAKLRAFLDTEGFRALSKEGKEQHFKKLEAAFPAISAAFEPLEGVSFYLNLNFTA